MSSEKVTKIFIFVLKLIFILLTLLFIYLIYVFSGLFAEFDFKTLDSGLIILLIVLLMSYFYLLFFIINLIGLFRKYNKLFSYVTFLTPIIPELFIFLRIYQSRRIVEEDISFLMVLYGIFFFFTFLFMKTRSSDIIGAVAGKNIDDLGDDYFCISIFSKVYPDEGDVSWLIKDIISNLLKYRFVKVNDIYIDNRKYGVWNFARKKVNPNFHTKHILLIEIYVKISEDLKQINITEESNFDENTYKCIYLYQYIDDGDKIFGLPSIIQDLYLAIKRILPEDTLIYYHKDDDITPPAIWSLRYNVFNKYLNLRYGTLIDKTEIKIRDIAHRLKEPHKRVLKYSFVLIILISLAIFSFNSIYNYLTTLGSATLLTIILLVPPALYYSIRIYDRFYKNKKAE